MLLVMISKQDRNVCPNLLNDVHFVKSCKAVETIDSDWISTHGKRVSNDKRFSLISTVLIRFNSICQHNLGTGNIKHFVKVTFGNLNAPYNI